MMRNHIAGSLKKTIVLLACFATGAFALTNTLTLQNPGGSGPSGGMGGVYTSPYGVSINGGDPVLMICDDYTTEINIGDTWQANVTTLTQITQNSVAGLKFAIAPYNSTPGIFGGPSNVAQDYAIAAVLSAQLLSMANIGTPSENAFMAGELSYAIWGVFDASLLTSTYTGYGFLTPQELSDAQVYRSKAQDLVVGATKNINGVETIDLSQISIGGQSINGLTIYTPAGPKDPGLSSSQEFLRVSMPEPSFPAILAVDLLAVVGLMVVFRRRISGMLN